MKKNAKKGFTLAELLVVVAIIGVLVAIAIPVFTAQLNKAKLATDHANIRAAYAMMQTAKNTGEIEATKIDGSPASTSSVKTKDLTETFYLQKNGTLAYNSTSAETAKNDAYDLQGTKTGDCELSSFLDASAKTHTAKLHIAIVFNTGKPTLKLID